MTNEFKRVDFMEAIKKAARVAPSTESKPTLTNILIQLEEDEASLIATDLDVAVVSKCQKLVPSPGGTRICANAKHLLDISQAVDGDSIDIELFEDERNFKSLKVHSGGYTANLPVADASDFPTVEPWVEKDIKEVPIDALVEGINRCSFSIADNEAKMNLMAVKIGQGYVQASDGSVTAVIKFNHDIGDVLIPAPAVKDLVQTIRNAGVAELKIKQTDSFIMFKAGEDVFLTRKSTASFPDILNKILKATEALPKVLTVDKEKMQKAFKRVGITSNARSKAVVCKIENDTMHISSFNQEGASSFEEIEVGQEVKDKSFNLLFNCEYIVDLLTSCHSTNIDMRFNNQLRVPVRFEDQDMTVLLMRLSDAMVRAAPEDENEKKVEAV